MKKTLRPHVLIAFLCIMEGPIIAGCGALNDNPTSADQMQTIRKKEALSRQNYNPSGSPTAGAAASR